jgi:diguanylate cyclase (GGDEF)-like protein
MMRVYDLINCAVFLPVSLVLETMVEKRKFMQFQLQRKIEGERDTDGLTTLLTRDAGQRMIELLLRDGAVKKASLVMMDLDNFKDINDTYGHPAGDVVLGAVGGMLERSFRDTDVLVRFGGDEFMLLLPNISDREDVKACMEKIRTRLATMATIPGYKQTASFGVAFFPEHGKTFEELFAQADKALYAAKYSGKDASCIYQEK